MSRRVLLIAYYFPPLGGGGVQRTLKFAKYLPDFGWVPHIVTVAGEADYVRDSSLLCEVPGQACVERVVDPDPFGWMAGRLNGIRGGWRIRSLLRYLEVPDRKIFWAACAYRRARRVIRLRGVEAIYTTSFPYSSHLVGCWLKRATGLPWVADFRDEWAGNPYADYPTRFHRWLSKKMEEMVLREADRVVTVSEPIAESLRARIPDRARVTVITNGFDRDDMDKVRVVAGRPANGCFRLTYTGSFYGHTTPAHFLTAVELLLERGAVAPHEIRVRLVGRVGEHRLRRVEWQGVVECVGYVDHLAALAELHEASSLLLVIPRERGRGAYSGKIFEYIALGKPILALVTPDSVAAELIRTSRTGVVVDPENVEAIASALLALVNAWRTDSLVVSPNEEVIGRYDRRELTRRLADLLEDIAGPGRLAESLGSGADMG